LFLFGIPTRFLCARLSRSTLPLLTAQDRYLRSYPVIETVRERSQLPLFKKQTCTVSKQQTMDSVIQAIFMSVIIMSNMINVKHGSWEANESSDLIAAFKASSAALSVEVAPIELKLFVDNLSVTHSSDDQLVRVPVVRTYEGDNSRASPKQVQTPAVRTYEGGGSRVDQDDDKLHHANMNSLSAVGKTTISVDRAHFFQGSHTSGMPTAIGKSYPDELEQIQQCQLPSSYLYCQSSSPRLPTDHDGRSISRNPSETGAFCRRSMALKPSIEDHQEQ
jgi:hypothetical protein